jgi:hypothetical protein
MTDDQFFLANAYLDGELTDEERTTAETDPEVLAAVEELRRLQAGLRDVEPPSELGRQRAVIAALEQFRVTASPQTHPFAGRSNNNRSYSRYLGIAAAVVAIGVLGVFLANANVGGDDEAAIEAETTNEAATAVLDSTTRLTEAFDAESQAASATAEATESVAGATQLEAAPAASTFAEESAEDSAAARSDSAGFDPNGPLTDPTQLARYARFVQDRNALVDGGITPETSCVFPDADHPEGIIDSIGYVLDGIEREVLVAVDPVTGQAFALDPGSCQVLVAAPLP